MAELRFGVLGPLEVYVDGRACHVPPGRQRAVLSSLLVHAPRPVSADALIDAAWRTDLPQEPHKALRTVLSRLRFLLGRDVIEMSPAGYRLAVRPSAVDAGTFDDLVARARSAQPHAAGELLGQALALWRGPAYGEYGDAPFATASAQRLEQARADATEAYAAALLQSNDPVAAVAALEDLLVEQPFREHALELLARALYHSGRQTDALRRLSSYRKLLADELGLDPSPVLDALQERILGHALVPGAAAPSRPPHWLDTSTAFIGREDELADLVAAVTTNQVTVVTGPGGVGKSRLAAEVLRLTHHRVGLPVAVTELLPVPSGRAGAALADALGVRAETASLPEDLVEYLTAVPHLLVLDNCEHVLYEITPLVSTIARRCRDVRIIATSRRRLGVPAERLVPLAPLRLPDAGAEPGAQSAVASVRLLADRVRRLRPAFVLSAQTTAQTAELCRRCDGLPLALELAASRVATSGLDEVLAHLPPDLDGAAPGGLRSVVAWSANLLRPGQRRLLELLSVFAGDFTAQDVRGLADRVPAWQTDTASDLAELVESSLVAERFVDGSARYRLLEMVRAFAGRSLQASGREDDARLAHAQWVCLIAEAIRADWDRTDGAEVAGRWRACSAEVAAALRWTLDAGHLELAASMSHAVARCMHLTPSLELSDLMIAVGERCAQTPGPRTASGIACAAFFTGERGDVVHARALASTAIEVTRERDDSVLAVLALAVSAMYAGELAESARWFGELARVPGLVGEAHSSLALIACYSDDLRSAEEHVQSALAAGPSSSDATHAFARYAAGELQARIDPDRGTVLLAEAAAEAERVGAEQVSRVSRVALFALLVRGGRRVEAAAHGLSLLRDLRRIGAWNQTWTTVRLLAELVSDAERLPDAAFLLAAARAAPSAPPVVGQDGPRYAALQQLLDERLGRPVVDQIATLAAAAPRADVLRRAERLLVGGLQQDP